jgi:hypothetical protein
MDTHDLTRPFEAAPLAGFDVNFDLAALEWTGGVVMELRAATIYIQVILNGLLKSFVIINRSRSTEKR